MDTLPLGGATIPQTMSPIDGNSKSRIRPNSLGIHRCLLASWVHKHQERRKY
jgi:hypothetical protein